MKNFFLAALALLLSVPGDAGAHTRSESYSHWHVSDSGITGTVTIPLREVMLLYQGADAAIPPRELFREHLVVQTTVSGSDALCNRDGADILQAPSGFVRVELRFDCRPETASSVRLRAMFDVVPSHVHYAKLYRDGVQVGEFLLTDTADRWSVDDIGPGSSSYTFGSFLRIGIEHIAGGTDHIAFLLGLLLIAGSVGRSIIAVTGFTLGHSISLAAAVLGYVHADSQLVEAFIGFTVALVAVEYFLLRRQDVGALATGSLALAWLTGLVAVGLGLVSVRALFAYAGFGIFAACYLLAARDLGKREDGRATALLFVATCCFGLIHGFGFAGFLMETGLLGTDLIVPLLGFNLGVEVGQLILVVAVLAAGLVLRNHVPRVLPQFAAAGLCGIGIFWFVERTLA